MHPIPILPAWLLELVRDVINKQSTYTNPLAKKGFVVYRSEEDMNIKATPLLRILGFCKAHNDGRLTAILHDASHKVLVCFSRESLIKYENKHLERLTYMSINSILLIKEANLRFITITQLPQLFGSVPGLKLKPGLGILVLEVTIVDSFTKQQLRVPPKDDDAVPFLYSDPEYLELCMEEGDVLGLEASRRYLCGDMVSDEEELGT
ncbi:hypothetical protein C7M61_003776 [Candidozyma pseudohaemuli]|uniref:Telomere replication protein EST3 n=1 Tax=Candidozyma pseudohaemuli TaxID=418784 RepID=A0A2P7YLV6_9ASCO|nr:hypothetical protein C7M61_003776 [[Candida] pseudohaemulonii]PSK36912.1 hypothetical protein C7M61_003776 [[Candida] pseudohaemulonii]